MRVALNVDLEPFRQEAYAAVDADAERVRGYFITLGAGQSMVYQQKREEAELVVGSPDPEAVSPALVPHVAGEAARTGYTIFDSSVVILTLAAQWVVVSAFIEEARLGAKTAILAAGTVDEIRAATEIDWSPVMQYIP